MRTKFCLLLVITCALFLAACAKKDAGKDDYEGMVEITSVNADGTITLQQIEFIPAPPDDDHGYAFHDTGIFQTCTLTNDAIIYLPTEEDFAETVPCAVDDFAAEYERVIEQLGGFCFFDAKIHDGKVSELTYVYFP